MDSENHPAQELLGTESRYKQNSYIADCCMVNTETVYPIMIVALSEKALAQEQKNIEKSLKKTFASANKDLSHGKKIAHLLILKSNLPAGDESNTRDQILEKEFNEKITQISGSPTLFFWG